MTTTATAPPVPIRDGRVDTKDTAKLVRRALKAAFPATAFSVRISRYSGGSSVTVDWTDGPTDTAVRQLTDVYSGVGFNSMDDSTTYSYAWLFPDGTAERVGALADGGGYGTYDVAGERVPDGEVNDYRRALRIGSGVTNTTLHGVDQDSPAWHRGLADGAAMTAKGASYVTFGGTVMTQRRLSDEYRAELGAAVLFLAISPPPGPFDGNTRYNLSVPSSIVVGNWADYGATLVWRLSGLEPGVYDAVMAQEAERRAHNAAVRASDEANT